MSTDSIPTSETRRGKSFEEMELNDDHEDSPHHDERQHFHVLAVDDSLIDRKLLEKLLTISSYHVTCVESGSKALEYLGLPDNLDNSSTSPPSTTEQQRAVNVNLIITDYCMPGISGYDLLRRVKKSSWKDVPVIVMSSENVPSRINRCLEEGAEEFLLKPVQLSDMKRLQPHLSKSLNSNLKENSSNSSCAVNNDNSSTEKTTNDSNNNHDHQSITESSSNTASNSNSNNNKRKAMSSPTDEIIPECIGLTVV